MDPTLFGLDGPTGPSGPSGPTYIMTIDQLVTSQSLAVQQETADRAALLPLSSPESFSFTQPLQLWANAGFPALSSILTITLNQPSPCADGTSRTSYEYVCYLLGTDIGEATVNLNSKFLGITISYILSGNTLSVCATRD
jgi:hypothetical protein